MSVLVISYGKPAIGWRNKNYQDKRCWFGLKLNANIDADFLGMTQEEAEHGKSMLSVSLDYGLILQIGCIKNVYFWTIAIIGPNICVTSGDIFAALPVIKRKGVIYDCASI